MIHLDEEERFDRITIVADFPKLNPGSAFSYWTDPAKLKKWWPPVADLDPRKGGRYHFSWPKQDWHLRGVFTEFQSGHKLVFTWKWDHESVDMTQVSLVFEPLTVGGTRLRLVHSGYTNDEAGRKIRNEHVEGWKFFLSKLQELTG